MLEQIQASWYNSSLIDEIHIIAANQFLTEHTALVDTPGLGDTKPQTQVRTLEQALVPCMCVCVCVFCTRDVGLTLHFLTTVWSIFTQTGWVRGYNRIGKNNGMVCFACQQPILMALFGDAGSVERCAELGNRRVGLHG